MLYSTEKNIEPRCLLGRLDGGAAEKFDHIYRALLESKSLKTNHSANGRAHRYQRLQTLKKEELKKLEMELDLD